MTDEDVLGGFVLDGPALVALGGEANIYATTWADRAAARGIVLLVPAAALSEAWQQLRRAGDDGDDQMRELLASPMIVVEALDAIGAIRAGDVVRGRDLDPDVSAAHVVTCARTRNWPVLSADATRLHVLDPDLTVETLPGMP